MRPYLSHGSSRWPNAVILAFQDDGAARSHAAAMVLRAGVKILLVSLKIQSLLRHSPVLNDYLQEYKSAEATDVD